MKKAGAVLLIAAGIIGWCLWKTKTPAPVAAIPPAAITASPETTPSNSTATGVSSAVSAVSANATAPGVSPATAAAVAPASPAAQVSGLPPLTVLDNARVAIHGYNDAFGENPVGDNSEITAALMGKNPKHVNFIRDDAGLRVNDKGELIDAWGTPFFFHQLSGQLMEIRSAGEDKKMWTFDDQVTR